MKRSAKLIAARAKAKRDGWLDWVRSEADERAILDGYYFDARRGDYVVEFGRKFLRHTEGSTWGGKPFELMKWQREDLFMPLFSWVHFDDEWGCVCRRYKKAYVQVPKKNGKSPTAAYIGLYMLVGDGEIGAKVFSAATSKDQAEIVHGHAMAMVRDSPQLQSELAIHDKQITFSKTNSTYKLLSADNDRNEGHNGHCLIADELHKWKGHELYNAFRWMFSSRAQPLFFQITTAGDNSQSVCFEQYEYCKGILSGLYYKPDYLPLIYEADASDDPGDEATWRKSNPSLGETVKASELRSSYEEAKHSTRTKNSYCQLRLNVWQTGTSGWLNAKEWDDNQGRRAV